MKTFVPTTEITLSELWTLRNAIRSLMDSTDIHYYLPSEAVVVSISGRQRRPSRRVYDVDTCDYDPNITTVIYNSRRIIALGEAKQIFVSDNPVKEVAIPNWAVEAMSKVYRPFQVRLVAWNAPTILSFVQALLRRMREDLLPIGVSPEWKEQVTVVFPVRTREFTTCEIIARQGRLSVFTTEPIPATTGIVAIERERVQILNHTVQFPGGVGEGIAVLDVAIPHGYYDKNPAWYVRTNAPRMIISSPDHEEVTLDLPYGVKHLVFVHPFPDDD